MATPNYLSYQKTEGKTFFWPNYFIFGTLVLLKFWVHYTLINPIYELHRDEFLHLDQGHHLAWGFVSVPPLTSWVAWFIHLLGSSEFWVKFFPALWGVLTMFVIWRTVETLKGGLFACFLATLAFILSVTLRINQLFQPNSFDILAWTSLYFFLVKYIQSGKAKWIFCLGIIAALGFLNKYNIGFLLMGLLPALLLSRHRSIFLKPQFYQALLLALIIISPNLIWQYEHNFPVLQHMRVLNNTQLIYVQRTDFMREQILFFLNSSFLLLAAFIAFFRFLDFKKYQVLFWSLVFTLLLFIFFKGKGYYAIGLYPIFLAFGAVYLEKVIQTGKKQFLKPIMVLVIVVGFLPLYKIGFPDKSPTEITQNPELYKELGMLRWEDGKEHTLPQDFADMLGWRELASKVDKVYRAFPNKREVLVLCDNYGQAGAINYYSKFKNIGAVSFNADYINWFPLDRELKTIILIKTKNNRGNNTPDETNLFKSETLVGQIENSNARELGTQIYLLQNPHRPVNDHIFKELKTATWF